MGAAHQLSLIEIHEVENKSVISDMKLTLDEKIERTINNFFRLFSENHHLLIATSMGKDSSVLLNLFLQAAKLFYEENNWLPQCVVANSNTGIENPIMDIYSRGEAAKVREFCRIHNLPISMDIIRPNMSNRYFTQIIGHRTIAVDAQNDSTCSDMMKVSPIERHKKQVFKRFGKDKVITCIGKRADESSHRAANMKASGENPVHPIKDKKGANVLSAIADFTLADIMTYIGRVRAGRIECYSNFDDLVEVYRGANDGSCMVNVYASGRASKTGCGARTGCSLCLRVADDKSMENMLKEEKNAFMRPLNELREMLKRNQYNPAKRTWLARSVSEDGAISITPGSYSPEYTEELLRAALTIDRNERDACPDSGPRFQLLYLEDVLQIELMWSRYGYHKAGQAMKIWYEVNVEYRHYEMPQNLTQYKSSDLKVTQIKVPFADSEYTGTWNGFRRVDAAIADIENTVTKINSRTGEAKQFTDALTGSEYSINDESAELFFEFEVENFIRRFSNSDTNPTEVFHYFVNLGVVSINKGGHSEIDRMLRMANQIHRHNLRPMLNSPSDLASTLSEKQEDMECDDLFNVA